MNRAGTEQDFLSESSIALIGHSFDHSLDLSLFGQLIGRNPVLLLPRD